MAEGLELCDLWFLLTQTVSWFYNFMISLTRHKYRHLYYCPLLSKFQLLAFTCTPFASHLWPTARYVRCFHVCCIFRTEETSFSVWSHCHCSLMYYTALTDPKLFGVSESQHWLVTEQNMIFYLLHLPFSSLKQIKTHYNLIHPSYKS